LRAVPDPTPRTSTTPFFAAGGADRRRDGDFLAFRCGGRRALVGLGRSAGICLVARGSAALVVADVDQGVLLGSFAHRAFTHGEAENMGCPLSSSSSDRFMQLRLGSVVALMSSARRVDTGSAAIAAR